MEYYKAYRLFNKCRTIAKKGFNEKTCKDISSLLLADKAVKTAEFLPLGDNNPQVGANEFYVTVLVADTVPAIFHIAFDTFRAHEERSFRHLCETLCADFNPKPVDKIVRTDTHWGMVEIHHTVSTHVNYYRPGKSTLFTDRVLQYITPEETDALIAHAFDSLDYKLQHDGIGFVDEEFSLDYPLFKMKVHRVEADAISHSVDEDGVWWVECPLNWDLTLENVQFYIKDYFRKVLCSAAQIYFEKRVAYMESRMHTGKMISKITVREIKERNAIGLNQLTPIEPGSTMDDGSRALTFEAALLMYPQKFSDKVIIHELCHNLIFDHSKKFRDLESNWSLTLTGVGPHYYDEFFNTHRLVPFAPDPWCEI